MIDCEVCGCGNATETLEDTVLETPSDTIAITIPVISCPDCELQYTDYRAEEIREKALLTIR